jgi:gliding motility-associated protein GldM
MIGLMYLVLTALLALNISKEIVNAFVTLDNKLAESNKAFLTKSGAGYDELGQAVALLKGAPAAKAWQAKGDEINNLSDGIDKFIVDLKNELISTVEFGSYDPKGTTWMQEVTDEAGATTTELRPISEINGKDQYDSPTSLFGGDVGSSGFERGASIRTRLHGFRDSLVMIMGAYKEGSKTFSVDLSGVTELDYFPKPINDAQEAANKTYDDAVNAALVNASEKDKKKLKQIYVSLTQPPSFDNHGEQMPWQLVLFDHAPVVAATAMFTTMQNDIRSAEAQAIEHIVGKVNAPKFDFNVIEPLAFARSSYINQGDSLVLKVMVAAYDSTAEVQVKYAIDDTLATMESMETAKGGNGQIVASGTSPGNHTMKGYIGVKEKGELKWKPWDYSYTVGAPTGTVANTEMNVLYIGYDNKIQASGSGYPTVKASCSGCSSFSGASGDGNYIAKVKGGKEATISVQGIDENGQSFPLAKMPFRIKKLPEPKPYFANQTFDRPTIKIGSLRNSKIMKAELQGSPLNINFTVTRFDLVVIKDGEELKLTSKSKSLTSQMKAAIKKIRIGQKVYFENIVAVGPNKKPLKIGGLTFKAIK